MKPDFRAWAEIDLGGVRHNLQVVRRHAGAARVWPVLKSNAYGHGAVQVAGVCEEEGVDRIGVGDGGEALELREAGIRTPLLILGTVIDAEVPLLLEHDVEVGVHSESRVRKLGQAARRAGRRLGVHLNVDTGMGRLGVRPEAAVRVAEAVVAERGLDLRGVMTHFASPAGCQDRFTWRQHAAFLRVLRDLRARGMVVPAAHCANSAALFTGLRPLGDAVRTGIAVYGVMPREVTAGPALRPVLTLRAQVAFLKDFARGDPVGYGSRWRAPGPTRVATLPMGYHDGIPYRLGASGRGQVLLRGRRCPIVGAVSMDYCTVDVGGVPGACVGDIATFIGEDGPGVLRAEDLAEAAGTIAYEVLCSIGSRVRRVYFDSSRRPEPAPARA